MRSGRAMHTDTQCHLLWGCFPHHQPHGLPILMQQWLLPFGRFILRSLHRAAEQSGLDGTWHYRDQLPVDMRRRVLPQGRGVHCMPPVHYKRILQPRGRRGQLRELCSMHELTSWIQ